MKIDLAAGVLCLLVGAALVIRSELPVLNIQIATVGEGVTFAAISSPDFGGYSYSNVPSPHPPRLFSYPYWRTYAALIVPDPVFREWVSDHKIMRVNVRQWNARTQAWE